MFMSVQEFVRLEQGYVLWVGSCYKAIVITNHDKKSIGSVSVSVCGELGGTRA